MTAASDIRVTEDGLELVDDSLGMQNMADSATLTDVYPILQQQLRCRSLRAGAVGSRRWCGWRLLAMTENFGGDSMSLTEMSRALGDASVHLDMLGFDACLMAKF